MEKISVNNRKVNIVAIGDSITYGYPFGPGYSWVYKIAVKFNLKIINKGIPGNTTENMFQRFGRDVLDLNPEKVIILGGTNDAFYNIPSGFVRNNIYKMVRLAEEKRIKPIVGLPIPINEEPFNTRLNDYRCWMRDFAIDNGYQIFDFYNILVDQSNGQIKKGYHEDGVHPNRLGYMEMAKVPKNLG